MSSSSVKSWRFSFSRGMAKFDLKKYYEEIKRLKADRKTKVQLYNKLKSKGCNC